jgi:hypothetical protein
MNEKELIQHVNRDLELVIPESIDSNELHRELAAYFNQLIQSDFLRLINLLYRLDISEVKLKQLLEQNTQQDSGALIAGLVIERQLEKIKSRQQFRQQDNDIIDEEERW